MNKTVQKIVAIGAGALIVGFTVGAVAVYQPTVDVEGLQKVAFNEGVASVVIPEPIECPLVEECAICPEDLSGEIELLEQSMLDQASETAFVYERMEDKGIIDDAKEIVAEIKAEDSALKLALEITDSDDFFDMLEDNNIVKDEDKVDVIKVFSDFEDIDIIKSDYDDDSYKFKFVAKIEDTKLDKKMHVELTVKVDDGEAVLKKVVKL